MSLPAVTVAVFVTSGHAASVAVTLTVIVSLCPAATVPRSQVSAWPLIVQPAAESIVRPVGTVSVTMTSVTSVVLVFWTVIV